MPFTEADRIVIPAIQIPTFRTSMAIERGVEKNLLFKIWGGLGDQICAEPTLRYAFKSFTDCKISLAAECPELFRHLPWHRVYNLKEVQPIWEKYFVFETIRSPDSLQWEFMSHMLVNCVDYPSLCALRCQLPVADRELKLEPSGEAQKNIHYQELKFERCVAIHAGRHWQSKTFPKAWWDQVILTVAQLGAFPVLIGGDTDDNRGTVDVEVSHPAIRDYRNCLAPMEAVELLKRIPVLLTNDSAPLHMAAAGQAHIGFVATCKHPDMIMHWRNGQFGWRMKNFGLGGIWDIIDYCPNKAQKIEAENVGDETLRSWLPDPVVFAEWAVSQLD